MSLSFYGPEELHKLYNCNYCGKRPARYGFTSQSVADADIMTPRPPPIDGSGGKRAEEMHLMCI